MSSYFDLRAYSRYPATGIHSKVFFGLSAFIFKDDFWFISVDASLCITALLETHDDDESKDESKYG